jgi:hypothetical protein
MDQLNLMDLNESSEAVLLDPSASGPLFLQLLVRSVGELRCEEDVEKLLLETDGNKFRATIKSQREYFSIRLKRKLDHLANHSADYQSVENPEHMLQMKLFGEYVGQLLDMSILALKKLLYILRLLSLCRKLRSGDPTPGSYSMKESIRSDIKKWWEIIEDLLVSELKIHLVEKSVQDIMDISRAELQQNKRSEDEDEDEDYGFNASDGKPVFTPTVRLAAPVFRKITSFSDTVRRLFYDEGVYLPQMASGDSNRSLPTGGASGPGPAGTGIQRQSSAVARQAGLPSNLMRSQSGTAGSAGGGKQPFGGSAEKGGSSNSVYSSKILELVHLTLENELLPVVQSAVNSEIQNIQTKPEMFIIQQDAVSGIDLMIGEFKWGDTNTVNMLFPSDGAGSSQPVLSPAALSCATVASPLFHYWLQLPQHRDMVITILDNLIRGFAASARDDVEGITFKFLCGGN